MRQGSGKAANGLGSGVNRRWLLAWFVLVCGASLPGRVLADEAETVTLGPAGPDREIPAGKAFHIAGTASKEVMRIQPLIVRKGSSFLFSTSGESCTELSKGFGPFKSDPKRAKPLAIPKPGDLGLLPELDPGIRSAAAIWERGTRGTKVLVPTAWERGEKLDEAVEFKIFIPGDTDFFREGYRYCLYVFEGRQTKQVDKEGVRARLLAHARTRDQCGSDEGCKHAEDDKFRAYLGAFPEADRERIEAAVKAVYEHTEAITGGPTRLRALLDAWAQPYGTSQSASGSFLKITALPLLWDIEHPMARVIVTLLLLNDGLRADIVTKNGKSRTVPFLPDGTMRVGFLGVLGVPGDVSKIKVSLDREPTNTKVLGMTVAALKLPRGALTVRDILELTQGWILVDKEYQRVTTLKEHLQQFLKDPLKATDEERGFAEKLEKRTVALDETFQGAFRASAGHDCSPAAPRDTETSSAIDVTPAAVETQLGMWLRCDVVLPCEAAKASKWVVKKEAADTCGDAPGKTAWPNYKHPGRTPFASIHVTLKNIRKAITALNAATDALTVVTITDETRWHAKAIEWSIVFTQKAWVGSYLTPVLGYAHIPNINDSIYYAGVQLHLAPNPIDEPQWSQWSDPKLEILRAFAIEAGFAPNAGAFGKEGRYDGPWALPPLFLGLSVHLLPYTSVTVGTVWLDTRRTTLPQERRVIDDMLYIGFNLQANIPDLIHDKLGYGKQTKVEK